MLNSSNLEFSYPGSEKLTFPNLNCQAGEKHIILGTSGVGKTTLLHILTGLLKPHSGKVVVDGTDIYSLSQGRLDQFRGDHIGIIFQQPHFVQSLNVIDNLLLTQQLGQGKIEQAVIDYALESMNMIDKKRSKVSNLSQGEKQRLAIARALINRPKVIFADEPTSALDDQNCENVLNLIEEVSNEMNAVLLIVTHDNRLKSRFHNQILL